MTPLGGIRKVEFTICADALSGQWQVAGAEQMMRFAFGNHIEGAIDQAERAERRSSGVAPYQGTAEGQVRPRRVSHQAEPCEWCVTGRYNLCPNVVFPSAPRAHGILREYVAHPAEMCFKLPDSMSFEEGALIEPLAVAMTAAREAGARIGQSAAILGSGCIGLVTLLALRAMGLSKITLVDLHDIRLDKAKELGAWATVNARETDPIAEVVRLHDGIGPDLVFETAGSTVAASQTIKMVKRGGLVMIVGNVTGETPLDLQLMTNKEITLKTNFRYSNIYPTTIDAVASGLIDVKSIISRNYPLRDAPTAFEDCINEKATMVKAVIQFEDA